MSQELIIPIYIDTNALLDLLASIEGGFSTVEKITSRSAESKVSERSGSAEAGTEFGIPNVLSLLRINIGGAMSSRRGQETGQESETEKYHTYGSLLHRLRVYLNNQGVIRRLDLEQNDWDAIRPSDFVEVRGVVHPNPLTDSFQRIDSLIGILQAYGGAQSSGQQQSSTSGRRRQQSSQQSTESRQMQQTRQVIRGIVSDVEKENIRTFVVDLTGFDDYRVVTLLFTNYLRDQSMAEISHREYRLLGKVVRKIDVGSEETIDLLRGSGLGGIGPETLDQLLDSFNQLPQMNLPQIESQVSGPALEIVPIAIYV